MKIAIVHYWLVGMRGGEKVLEALCEIYPDADIFTHVYNPQRISQVIKQHKVKTTFISKLPFSIRLYQRYLPLMPLALEQLDLRGYDLVISSESGPAKGVITSPDTLHVCYCHSPMRYVWNMYLDYYQGSRWLTRWVIPWLAHRLRMWDFQSAARVDFFVANSANVRKRIRKYYGRGADVIHPPVDVLAFEVSKEQCDFYLYVGQLVQYKRVDLAIRACHSIGRKLIIIGEGEDELTLRRIASSEVTFLGRADRETLAWHYSKCRAVVFPGEEDFGIVPLEAMASGRPVIAFGRGGALETVVDAETGILFHDQTPASLAEAILRFEDLERTFEADRIVAHASSFSKEQFKIKFKSFINKIFAERQEARPPALSFGENDKDAVSRILQAAHQEP